MKRFFGIFVPSRQMCRDGSWIEIGIQTQVLFPFVFFTKWQKASFCTLDEFQLNRVIDVETRSVDFHRLAYVWGVNQICFNTGLISKEMLLHRYHENSCLNTNHSASSDIQPALKHNMKNRFLVLDSSLSKTMSTSKKATIRPRLRKATFY